MFGSPLRGTAVTPGVQPSRHPLADPRPPGDLYEVALWEDLVSVDGRELRFAYMVDDQAIVIPETIDAIRSLAGPEGDAEASMGRTNAALGIGELGLRSGA